MDISAVRKASLVIERLGKSTHPLQTTETRIYTQGDETLSRLIEGTSLKMEAEQV